MKKLTFAPIAALALAACADMPTAPEMPLSADGLTSSASVWQAGNGRAWHGYDAPTLSYDIDGRNVTLCASWTDDENFDRSSTTFYSFDFLLQNEETGDWDKLDSARGDESGNDACLLVEDLEDGTYLFAANGMARVGSGRNTTTNHTLDATVSVTIGGADPVWSIEIVGGNAANGTFPRNQGEFVLVYRLLLDGAVVLDCTRNVVVTPTPESANCDAEGGTRNLQIPNPDRGTAGTELDVVFEKDGVTLLVFPVIST
jgi:hypothetical protein